jgi:hypothetical protein
MTRVGSQRHRNKLFYYNLMGPPSYVRTVVDRNVVMRRMTVIGLQCDYTQSLLYLTSIIGHFLALLSRACGGVLGERAKLM